MRHTPRIWGPVRSAVLRVFIRRRFVRRGFVCRRLRRFNRRGLNEDIGLGLNDAEYAEAMRYASVSTERERRAEDLARVLNDPSPERVGLVPGQGSTAISMRQEPVKGNC